MNIGSGLIDLLGKTLSGQTADRDPFAAPAKEEPAPGDEPDKKAAVPPAAEAPAGDPFETPAQEVPRQATSRTQDRCPTRSGSSPSKTSW